MRTMTSQKYWLKKYRMQWRHKMTIYLAEIVLDHVKARYCDGNEVPKIAKYSTVIDVKIDKDEQ